MSIGKWLVVIGLVSDIAGLVGVGWIVLLRFMDVKPPVGNLAATVSWFLLAVGILFQLLGAALWR